MRGIRKNISFSLYESLTTDEYTTVKEATIGSIVKDKDGKTYYKCGSTFNGFCFKDEDTYDNKPDDVCYITEHGFEEDSDVVSFDYINANKEKLIADGTISTHNSIKDELLSYWDYIGEENTVNKDFLEAAAFEVFEIVDWQTTSGMCDEYDWDSYLEANNKTFDDVVEPKEELHESYDDMEDKLYCDFCGKELDPANCFVVDVNDPQSEVYCWDCYNEGRCAPAVYEMNESSKVIAQKENDKYLVELIWNKNLDLPLQGSYAVLVSSKLDNDKVDKEKELTYGTLDKARTSYKKQVGKYITESLNIKKNKAKLKEGSYGDEVGFDGDFDIDTIKDEFCEELAKTLEIPSGYININSLELHRGTSWTDDNPWIVLKADGLDEFTEKYIQEHKEEVPECYKALSANALVIYDTSIEVGRQKGYGEYYECNAFVSVYQAPSSFDEITLDDKKMDSECDSVIAEALKKKVEEHLKDLISFAFSYEYHEDEDYEDESMNESKAFVPSLIDTYVENYNNSTGSHKTKDDFTWQYMAGKIDGMKIRGVRETQIFNVDTGKYLGSYNKYKENGFLDETVTFSKEEQAPKVSSNTKTTNTTTTKPKTVRDVLDNELEDDDTPTGGTAFSGETVKDFIGYDEEGKLDPDSSVKSLDDPIDVLNKDLVSCGIKPIAEAVKPKSKDKRVVMQQGNVTCIKDGKKYHVFEDKDKNEKIYKSEDEAMKDLLNRVGVDPNRKIKNK